MRDQMRKIFNECYHDVQVCEDPDTGKHRWELFKELSDRRVCIFRFPSHSPYINYSIKQKQDYPDHYQMIANPIAMSHLRKRPQSNYYKDVAQYCSKWKLLFDNACTYNVEGSLMYVDVDKMEKVLDATFRSLTVGSGLPGAAPAGSGSGSGEGLEALRRGIGRTNSKQILSDDEDSLTLSDDDWIVVIVDFPLEDPSYPSSPCSVIFPARLRFPVLLMSLKAISDLPLFPFLSAYSQTRFFFLFRDCVYVHHTPSLMYN